MFLQVPFIISLTVFDAAFWWLHREQLLNLCLLYQAKRLACWREMGLLKVVDMALFDGGQNPLGSFNCFCLRFLAQLFNLFWTLCMLYILFLYLFIYLFRTYKLYHRHFYFFFTVFDNCHSAIYHYLLPHFLTLQFGYHGKYFFFSSLFTWGFFLQ